MLKGMHLNIQHFREWGPLVYSVARLLLLVVWHLVGSPTVHLWVWCVVAFLVLNAIFVTNDRTDFGDPPLPPPAGYVYAVFEVLSAWPFALAAMALELIALLITGHL